MQGITGPDSPPPPPLLPHSPSSDYEQRVACLMEMLAPLQQGVSAASPAQIATELQFVAGKKGCKPTNHDFLTRLYAVLRSLEDEARLGAHEARTLVEAVHAVMSHTADPSSYETIALGPDARCLLWEGLDTVGIGACRAPPPPPHPPHPLDPASTCPCTSADVPVLIPRRTPEGQLSRTDFEGRRTFRVLRPSQGGGAAAAAPQGTGQSYAIIRVMEDVAGTVTKSGMGQVVQAQVVEWRLFGSEEIPEMVMTDRSVVIKEIFNKRRDFRGAENPIGEMAVLSFLNLQRHNPPGHLRGDLSRIVGLIEVLEDRDNLYQVNPIIPAHTGINIHQHFVTHGGRSCRTSRMETCFL